MGMYACGCHNNVIGMVYRFEFNTQHHYMTYVCIYVLQSSCDHCEKWMHRFAPTLNQGQHCQHYNFYVRSVQAVTTL